MHGATLCISEQVILCSFYTHLSLSLARSLFRFNYRLTKTEIVAFMNTLGKFSDSILFHHLFQKMIAEASPRTG